MSAATDGRMYLWTALGSPDNPPDRIMVESCTDCAALVPVARFDQHGKFHRALLAAGVTEGR